MDLDIKIQPAERDHLEQIVALLANDELGSQRENFKLPLPDSYEMAFQRIDEDPYQMLMVAVIGDRVVGTFQLTFINYLTYQGGVRAQIEGVRVHEDMRSRGIGRKMFEWAIDQSRSYGAHVLQLTTDKKRPEALKFYESLGFKSSHEGLKLHF